jgi:hypothetical protein
MLEFIHKIPILTTLLSAVFSFQLYAHWKSKGKPSYLFWWLLGVICYGLGTLTESWVGLFSWSEPVFKAWYILGALLGGFPLAQGTVYLIFARRTATIMMSLVLALVVVASVGVILSPIHTELVEPARLTGRVLAWTWVRYCTPFINIYAFIFLVGGAAWSAYRYSKNPEYKSRFLGNLCIAIGGLLPGIGGSFTKFGYTEVLYVTELIGILFIYWGYRTIRSDKAISVYEVQSSQR